MLIFYQFKVERAIILQLQLNVKTVASRFYFIFDRLSYNNFMFPVRVKETSHLS